MSALRRKASRPMSSHRGPAATSPPPIPARVAPSKRADIRPRRSSSLAVIIAMNPRIEGTLTAVEAPSRIRVPPMSDEVGRLPREDDGDRPEDRPDLHEPVVAEPVGQHPERGREEQLRPEEHGRVDGDDQAVDLAATVGRQVVEVVDEQRAREAGAETERERADQHGPQAAVHEGPKPNRSTDRGRSAPRTHRGGMDRACRLAPVPLALGSRGAVVAPHHLATAAGLRVLERGGGAVDAAIATNAVLAVVVPNGCGLGGDAFWLVWDASGRRLHGLNGSGRAPAAASAERLRAVGLREVPRRGPESISVPGAVRSWSDAHARWGRLARADVLADAIELASGGFPAWDGFIDAVERTAPVADAALGHDNGFRRVYRPHDRRWRPGERVRLPALAATLERLTIEGFDTFYDGDLGEQQAGLLAGLGAPIRRDRLPDTSLGLDGAAHDDVSGRPSRPTPRTARASWAPAPRRSSSSSSRRQGRRRAWRAGPDPLVAPRHRGRQARARRARRAT